MAETTDGAGRKPCAMFLRGRCTYGDQCKFSHKFENDEAAAKHAQRQTALKELDDKLRTWRHNIPRDKRELRRVVPLGSRCVAFITTALELVETDAERMQEVITSLASEGGLARIGELLDLDNLPQMSQQAIDARFEHRIIPLIKLMSNEEVLMSAIIESQHATICNYLFGVNAVRSVALFAAVLRCLPTRMSALSACIITMAYIYSVNSLAQLNQELGQHAEKLCELAEGAKLEGSAARHLQSLCTRLGLISKIEDALEKPKKKIAAADLPRFIVEQDLPGALSRHGPRHDNDKEDFDDIAIMPTIGEIESERNEYLPSDDPQDWHVDGMLGLLDRQFRLLREDTVGQLRDAAKFELDRLQQAIPDKLIANRGARTRRYDNVQLVDMIFHPFKGLMLVLSFDQPQILAMASNKKRREYWEESKRLEIETLICLLGSNGYTAFLTISLTPAIRPGSMTEGFVLRSDARWSDTARVTVLARLVDESAEEVEALLKNLSYGVSYTVKHCLIEFPGILLPAFKPTLTALQEMSFTESYPFANILGPLTKEEDEQKRIPPPLYAQHPDFRYNLSCLVTDGQPLTLDPAHPCRAQDLCARSDLDLGQAEAIISALTHSFALIQGPPGTGKSYTGEALMKVLLANRRNGDLNSILFTSYTNHALDQALEHHIDAGVQQIVRIGSRSKSEKLSAINLNTVAMQHDDTKKERSLKWKIRKTLDETSNEIHVILAELRSATHETSVKNHLARTAEHFCNQLFHNDVEIDEQGQQWQVVGRKRLFDEWLAGGTHVSDARPLHALRDVMDLDELTHTERSRLHEAWCFEIMEPIQRKLIDKLAVYSEEKQSHDKIEEELKLRVLTASNVIGVTTSGLARNLSYLRRLNSKVLVVEEAGEVLEAHILTALLPSIEHVILIGDHQQLRPKAQNYDLSCENPRSQTTLDISLFERLVQPKPGFGSLPYSTLNTQRRMHPDISALIRDASYPALIDAPSVFDHPPVTGMKHRLFWFDHAVLEDSSQHDDVQSTSHTNEFEVEMVSSLVQHIVNQGVYNADDIAVITPYLGQLRKLRRKLQQFSHIVLNERDDAELALDDSEENVEEAKPTYSRSSLLRAVRLATVDNFQGEEAKVVIISLVRSNKLNKCGFLRTSNRINVLLSRAKHGMYIIGNTATAASVPMWHNVITQLGNERVGQMLSLCCPRHPDTPIQVQKPDDFLRLSPEAGCDLQCGLQLSCGHSCTNKCHSELLHDAVVCLKPCTRLVKGCEHLCPNTCGSACPDHCRTLIPNLDITLPCGHHVTELECWLHQDESKVLCDVLVERTMPGCSHEVRMYCSQNVSELSCAATCGAILDCGHACTGTCSMCRTLGADGKLALKHKKCSQTCDRAYTTCSHFCRSTCHGESACPPCTAKCEKQCMHGRCNKRCNEPCAPCAEPVCASGCKHSQCSMPCAAPCDWVPCSLRCDKMLACGHRCPSVCGRKCPSEQYCQICAPDDIKAMRADLILMSSYGEVDLDESPCIITSCGHIFTVDSLDGVMNMTAYYDMDITGMPMCVNGPSIPFSYKEMKSCPDCRASLADVERYGRIIKRATLDESTKKFVSWSNRRWETFAKDVQKEQDTLLTTREDFEVSVKLLAEFDKSKLNIANIVKLLGDDRRYRSITVLRGRLTRFSKEVRTDEIPFQKVKDLVELAKRRAAPKPGPEAFRFDSTILSTRGGLLVEALRLRLDCVMFNDLAYLWKKLDAEDRPEYPFDFGPQRNVCEHLIHRTEEQKYPLQQTEGHIFWAQFAAIQLMMLGQASMYWEEVAELQQKAVDHLDKAQALCEKYRGQTQSVQNEVEETRKMLNGLSPSEMRMVVRAMAMEFSATGHWYRCVNNHPFTIGECGMPMERATCPECGAGIGGENHNAVAGMSHAEDIEREFGNLQV